MRSTLLVLAVLSLFGCAGEMYNVGASSTGPLSSEPDPFELLGRDVPIGVRLDLAAARATSSGPDFDVILRRFVRAGVPVPSALTLDVLERTDLAVLGMRPGVGNDTAAVVIVRGRYVDADVYARLAASTPVVAATHRDRPIVRTGDFTLALLDDHLLVLGDDAIVASVIDHYLDRARPVPGSPAVASSWDFEHTQLTVVVMPTPRIREELRRSPPFEGIAAPLERIVLRVMKTESGETVEIRVETTSHEAALAFSLLVQDEIGEVARNAYADVSGLSVLLRALRVEVEGGNVRIVGESTDAEVARFARAAVEIL